MVDFYCHEAMLVVEVDGSQHFDPDHQDYDAYRSAALESLGMKVMRFTNREVATELDAVLESIWREMKRRLPSP